MLWFGTALALFLGGFIGHMVGLSYDLPIVGMIAGALVFALSYKPKEVLTALGQAVNEVASWDRDAWQMLSSWVVWLVGFATSATFWTALLYYSIPRARVTSDIAISLIFGLVFSAICLLLTMVLTKAEDEPKIDTWVTNTLFGAVLALFPVPMSITFFVTRRAIPALYQFWHELPDVFFLFCELIATHDRIAGMAAVATGVLIGMPFGIPVLTGAVATVIGLPLIGICKIVAKKQALPVHNPA